LLDKGTDFVIFFTNFGTWNNDKDFRGFEMTRFRLFLISAVVLFFVGGNLLADKDDSTKSGTVLSAHGQPTDSAKVGPTPNVRIQLDTIDTDTVFDVDDFAVIETHHRLYPDFLQTDTVRFHQRFQIGEEPIFAQVERFVADLKITMKGEKVKMSDTLFNPAVLVRVWITDTVTHKDSLSQETWAFLYGGSPHFSKSAFFAFNLRNFKVANPKYITPPERK
jgi:hypothetical protein